MVDHGHRKQRENQVGESDGHRLHAGRILARPGCGKNVIEVVQAALMPVS